MISNDSRPRQNAQAQGAPDSPCQTLFGHLQDGVLVVDMAGHYVEANRAACKLLGYSREELLNLDVFQIEARGRALPPAQRAGYLQDRQRTWRRGSAASTSRWVAKTGAPVDVEVSITPLVYQGQEAALALARAVNKTQGGRTSGERLAVLGQLAAGVGHELRNPLSSITNAVYYLNLVLNDLEPDTAEVLEILNQQVSNCSRIISSLLNYAQPGLPALIAVEVRRLVAQALAQQAVPEQIEVAIRLDEPLPPVWADEDQLLVVFGNVIRNAMQAMPAGGRLTVVATATPTGDEVSVAFHDTGEGIPPAQVGRVFEPLFTTKTQGIGLGLAMSKQLVAQMGGRIQAASPATEPAPAPPPGSGEMGPGSTFTVSLPAAEKPAPVPDETSKR